MKLILETKLIQTGVDVVISPCTYDHDDRILIGDVAFGNEGGAGCTKDNFVVVVPGCYTAVGVLNEVLEGSFVLRLQPVFVIGLAGKGTSDEQSHLITKDTFDELKLAIVTTLKNFNVNQYVDCPFVLCVVINFVFCSRYYYKRAKYHQSCKKKRENSLCHFAFSPL